MGKELCAFLSVFFVPLAAFSAAEGVPAYYQKDSGPNANQVGYDEYAQQGYTNYVGASNQKQVVGTRSYSYQVPVTQTGGTRSDFAQTSGRQAIGTRSYSYQVPSQQQPVLYPGATTVNGIAMPLENEKKTTLYADYTRRFADFEFETGVNSVLEWDDMVFNEITAGLRHTFTLGKFDLGFYGEYTYGDMSHGGLSMDYDLKPFDNSDPTYGIFTASVGDEDGKTHHIDLGISAHHIWDIGGWKFSPRIGYEIFKHNLKMSDHYYPNPGMYIPMMTVGGDYVFGTVDTENGDPLYYSVPINATDAVPESWSQICMTPNDIRLVDVTGSGYIGTELPIGDYPGSGLIPWGVGPDECVIIGGDGPIIVGGTTHIYETTWSGFYLGLEVEKQMTLSDKLRMYVQVGLPKYSSEGTWPNRTDWQQNPSFLDEGRNGSYSYKAELEYNMRLSDRLQLALKVDTNYYHVGKIDGEQYWASETLLNPILDEVTGDLVGYEWITYPAYTEHVTKALKSATWQSFGLHAGLKLSF